nr:hypothetical protein BaRGS_012067 [Batillaria attramentaria]
MAGVDKSDQMISYLPLHRKTIKWWKKLSFHLLTLTMIQSHILYNKHRQLRNLKAKQLDGFVKSVCNEFAAAVQEDDADAEPTGAADPDATADMLRLRPGDHFPVTIPPANAEQTRKTQRGCKMCYAKRKKEEIDGTQDTFVSQSQALSNEDEIGKNI